MTEETREILKSILRYAERFSKTNTSGEVKLLAVELKIKELLKENKNDGHGMEIEKDTLL